MVKSVLPVKQQHSSLESWNQQDWEKSLGSRKEMLEMLPPGCLYDLAAEVGDQCTLL